MRNLLSLLAGFWELTQNRVVLFTFSIGSSVVIFDAWWAAGLA